MKKIQLLLRKFKCDELVVKLLIIQVKSLVQSSLNPKQPISFQSLEVQGKILTYELSFTAMMLDQPGAVAAISATLTHANQITVQLGFT